MTRQSNKGVVTFAFHRAQFLASLTQRPATCPPQRREPGILARHWLKKLLPIACPGFIASYQAPLQIHVPEPCRAATLLQVLGVKK